ncbi:MAG: hypothetical protein ACTHME_05260 [Candidatus Nitrosocosmicus sp.]
MNELKNSEAEQPVANDVQPDAKVMQQHEINALVGGAKQKGREQGRLEGYQQAKAELMAQMQPENNLNSSNAQNTSANQMLSNDSDDKLRKIAVEELAKMRAAEEAKWVAQQNEQHGMRILNELKSKATAANSKFDDYEKVVKPDFSNFAKTPEVLLLANQFDNGGEMLYDMAKNPAKIAQITMMQKLGMNDEAFAEMKKLSDSIKVNELAATQPKPKAPLSQVSPSNVGVGKVDGKVSSRDFRGAY